MVNSYKIIGYSAKDNYGRSIGQVICFVSNPKGNIEKIVVKRADGAISEFDQELFDIKPTEVVIYDALVLKARTLSKELILGQRRLEAIEKLRNESRITPLTFEELRKEFADAYESARNSRDRLIEELKRKNVEMAKQIMYLQRLMAIADVQYMTGEIDESQFRMAVSEVKSSIDKVTEEKVELDKEFELLNLRVEQKEETAQPPKAPEEATVKTLTVIPGKSVYDAKKTAEERPIVRLT